MQRTKPYASAVIFDYTSFAAFSHAHQESGYFSLFLKILAANDVFTTTLLRKTDTVEDHNHEHALVEPRDGSDWNLLENVKKILGCEALRDDAIFLVDRSNFKTCFFATLLQTVRLSNIHFTIQHSTAPAAVKRTFVAELMKYHLEHLAAMQICQQQLLKIAYPRLAATPPRRLFDAPEKEARRFLAGLQLIILQTPWVMTPGGGKAVLSALTGEMSKVPPKMKEMLDIISQADDGEMRWCYAFDMVVDIAVKAEKHYPWRSYLVRDNLTTEFYRGVANKLELSSRLQSAQSVSESSCGRSESESPAAAASFSAVP
jgi:hypothetical protein